jgi:hypothetical protein
MGEDSLWSCSFVLWSEAILAAGTRRNIKKIMDKMIGDIIGAHEEGNAISLHSKKHHEKNVKCAGA